MTILRAVIAVRYFYAFPRAHVNDAKRSLRYFRVLALDIPIRVSGSSIDHKITDVNA